MAHDGLLGRNANFVAREGIAFCHLDLGLDNVDARNHFRYCMFDLDAGIHFNEVEVTVRRHKKFDGTGVDVVHVLHERYGRVADFLAELPRKSKGRRDFDDFLMAALDGAVPLIKVEDIPVFIAHDLDFDVLWIADVFFKIDLVIAKGEFSFGFCSFIGVFQVTHAMGHAHAASAATIDGFQHNGKAHILGKLFHFSKVHDWSVTAGNKPDTGLFGLCAGVDFVTEHGEVVDMGANERDAFFGAAPSKVCVFRKKAIAGMDGVDMVLMGHPDDLFYIKVGIDWLFPFPDQIRLIGAEAMEG